MSDTSEISEVLEIQYVGFLHRFLRIKPVPNGLPHTRPEDITTSKKEVVAKEEVLQTMQEFKGSLGEVCERARSFAAQGS